MIGNLIAVGVGALLALTACAGLVRPAAGATPGVNNGPHVGGGDACGEPTKLAAYPGGALGADGKPWLGALVGPLFFSAFGGSAAQRAELPAGSYVPGDPTKVAILVTRTMTAPITLEGRQCGGDARLRFWYRNEAFPGPTPLNADKFASVGDLEATLVPFSHPAVTQGPSAAYSGYILFSGPGKWKVTVSQGEAVLGSVIVRVPDAPSSVRS